MAATTAEKPQETKRADLFRADARGLEIRAAEDGGMPTLHGHFVPWNEWTEINSIYEGNFMERFAPGAFTKTIQESRDAIKVLFQHGHDPVAGDKPLGKIDVLEEDKIGARYEVSLLDAPYVRDILPGLEAGLYGASFRFEAMQERVEHDPERSDTNPEGIPERTVVEARLKEFSPVTFPAYAGSTAGIRSLSDEFNIFDQLGRDPERARELFAVSPSPRAADEHSKDETTPEPRPPHSTRTLRLDRRTTLERSPEWRLP